MGLVGESGSGKSTVAYTTIGMYRPTSGEPRFRGQELFRRRKAAPAGAQERDPDRLPGSRLVAEPQAQHQADPGDCRCGSTARRSTGWSRSSTCSRWSSCRRTIMYKYPHMLSGGEKQMVAIARALATEPSLRHPRRADVGAGRVVQAKIINLLIRLQREFNLSYLFITHDLSLMRNVASRVAIMYLGKICEIAETVEFFRNAAPPLHPDAALLDPGHLGGGGSTQAARRSSPRARSQPGQHPQRLQLPQRCPFEMDVCSNDRPGDGRGEPGHTVRCHLFRSRTSIRLPTTRHNQMPFHRRRLCACSQRPAVAHLAYRDDGEKCP